MGGELPPYGWPTSTMVEVSGFYTFSGLHRVGGELPPYGWGTSTVVEVVDDVLVFSLTFL